MDLAAPYTPFLSATDAEVISALARTTKPLGGRELARLLGRSPNGVWKSLRRLTEHGLAIEETAGGRALVYTINRDHLALQPALELIRLRQALIDRIRERIGSWELQPVHASLFGSAARGEGDTVSDIDILIVRPKGIDEDDARWRQQLNGLADSVLRWTGNHAGLADIPQRELSRLKVERPSVVAEIEKDAVPLAGIPVTTLFRAKR